MPVVKFVSKIQSRRFHALQRRQAFLEGVIAEIVKPVVDAQRRANQEMDLALQEIGVPTDSRDVRIDTKTDSIFFEDADWEWSHTEERPVERSAESRAAWLKRPCSTSVAIKESGTPAPVVPPATPEQP